MSSAEWDSQVRLPVLFLGLCDGITVMPLYPQSVYPALVVSVAAVFAPVTMTALLGRPSPLASWVPSWLPTRHQPPPTAAPRAITTADPQTGDTTDQPTSGQSQCQRADTATAGPALMPDVDGRPASPPSQPTGSSAHAASTSASSSSSPGCDPALLQAGGELALLSFLGSLLMADSHASATSTALLYAFSVRAGEAGKDSRVERRV